MSKNEHLQWAKDRALKEPKGLLMWISFLSDIGKHSELKNHIALGLWLTIDLSNDNEARKFIEGFN